MAQHEIIRLRVHGAPVPRDSTEIQALGEGCFASKRPDLLSRKGTNAACEFIIEATKSYWGEKARGGGGL